jgi:hypothetical protein
MKKSLAILTSILALTISNMACAGDLSVVCYTDGDIGSFVGNFPNQFIDNRAGLTFKISKDTFVVLVNRTDELRDYEYRIIKISGVDGGYSLKKINVQNYDTVIDINGGVQCKIID